MTNGIPLSHTVDEPDHLGMGMEWMYAGTYHWDPSHPPLARVLPAIAVSLAGARFVPAAGAQQEGMAIWGRDAHYDRMLAISRAGILPFFWLACGVVFLWARRIAGGVAGVAAVLVFTLVPAVLAHGGLVTTDMAATSLCALGAYVALLWAERTTWARTFWFGVVLGLGVLGKFSVPVFLPAIWLFWLVWRRPSIAEMRGRVVPAMVAVAVGCLVIWAGYRFTVLPFWEGLEGLLKHNRDGHSSFIIGHRIQLGVWYFFPVTLLVKTPIGILLMGVASFVWRGRREIALPLLYAAAILAVAMGSNINIGVRHVLPLFVGVAIAVGVMAVRVWNSRARWPVVVLLAWAFVSGWAAQPDLISYTNEITRGRPEEWVAESDLDWGQDMHRVAAFLAAHGAREVSFTPYAPAYLTGGHAMPKTTPSDWFHSAPGWNVVSLSGWKVFNHPGWVKFPPQYRIGRTHWAWYFPPGEPSKVP